jgi:CelD/BcsL family acetyltransferase involved in cellulose biosynthesis
MPIGARAATWDVVSVSGVTGLARWHEAWRAAAAQASTERLFLEPEWILPWCEEFGRQPRLLFAVQAGRPRAAAILVAERWGPGRAGPLVLRPPGLGVSDYLDLLLPSDSAAAQAAVAALLDWLIESDGWDLLDLPNVPDESPTPALLMAAAAQRGLSWHMMTTFHRPFIALNGAWAGYEASRPRKVRANLRARRRHLAAQGQLRYRHYASPIEVAEQLERAVEVHARRWRGQHTSTTFSSSKSGRRFYAAAAQGMAARGWLDFSTLELGGRLLAFCLGFIRHGKFYYYLPAFDPSFARYAPGTALVAHLIESAYARGLREFDFMLGDEPYKDQWATGRRTTKRLVLAAPGLRGAIALTAFRAYLGGREWARRTPSVQRARRYWLGRLVRR